MKVQVMELSSYEREVEVELPADKVRHGIDHALKSLKKRVKVPGFRKGKVPQRIIDQRFGRGTVVQEAVNEALPELYGQAMAEHDLTPLGQPEVNINYIPPSTPPRPWPA